MSISTVVYPLGDTDRYVRSTINRDMALLNNLIQRSQYGLDAIIEGLDGRDSPSGRVPPYNIKGLQRLSEIVDNIITGVWDPQTGDLMTGYHNLFSYVRSVNTTPEINSIIDQYYETDGTLDTAEQTMLSIFRQMPFDSCPRCHKLADAIRELPELRDSDFIGPVYRLAHYSHEGRDALHDLLDEIAAPKPMVLDYITMELVEDYMSMLGVDILGSDIEVIDFEDSRVLLPRLDTLRYILEEQWDYITRHNNSSNSCNIYQVVSYVNEEAYGSVFLFQDKVSLTGGTMQAICKYLIPTLSEFLYRNEINLPRLNDVLIPAVEDLCRSLGVNTLYVRPIGSAQSSIVQQHGFVSEGPHNRLYWCKVIHTALTDSPVYSKMIV